MFDSKCAAHAFWAFCGIYLLKTTKMPRGNHIVCSFNRHVRSFPCYSCSFLFIICNMLNKPTIIPNLFHVFSLNFSSKKLPWSAPWFQARVGDALRVEMPHRFDVCVLGRPKGWVFGATLALEVGIFHGNTLWWTYKKLLKMAIEIVDLWIFPLIAWWFSMAKCKRSPEGSLWLWLSSGKRANITNWNIINHFWWVNQLFLWSFTW